MSSLRCATTACVVLVILAGCTPTPEPRESLVYSTDFESVAPGWADNTTLWGGNVTLDIANGQFLVINRNANRRYWWFVPYGYGSYPGKMNAPYSVQVDMTCTTDGAGTVGACGLEFNWLDDGDEYIFYLWPSSGTYGILRTVGGAFVHDPVPSVPNSRIKAPGQLNTVKLRQLAGSLQVFIDGHLVGTYGISLPAGSLRTGVLSSSWNSTGSVTASYDNLSLFSVQE